MKKQRLSILTALVLYICCAAIQMTAQTPISNADRQRWLTEMREYKHDFLAKELTLSKEQQKEFFPLYDKMEAEIEQLNIDTRKLETAANENDQASDLELENAARTIFELKRAEGQIEMTYFEQFKDILSPRQLLQLKNAERKFTQALVKHHRSRPRK